MKDDTQLSNKKRQKRYSLIVRSHKKKRQTGRRAWVGVGDSRVGAIRERGGHTYLKRGRMTVVDRICKPFVVG